VHAAKVDIDQAIANDIDRAIIRAIGDELRRARTSAGWSRPELIKRMKTQIPVNTYACYEQGIRQCSIPRLIEICRALEVGPPDLIGLALQRLQLDLDKSDVRIDLCKIIHDDREALEPLRQWARNRIEVNARTADSNESTVVRLQWAVVTEMAVFCGVSQSQLFGYIREFTPESAPRS
jgi:transcriptional regulator with XRE-family HTH domain